MIVPADAPGFSRGKTEHHLSGEHHCMLYFDECRVPKDYVLMSEQGFKKLMSVFNVERMGNSIRSLAVAELAYEKSLQYVKERKHSSGRFVNFRVFSGSWRT